MSSAPTVRLVQTAEDMKVFVRFPWRVYANDSHWVPPLLFERKRFFDVRHNPFFKHAEAVYFLAERDGEVRGTIAACVDHDLNRFYEKPLGLFGFFEVFDDYEVAAALLDAACGWARERGMQALRGPCNFSTNQEVGLLIDGFDYDPVILTTYNPPYYQHLVERYGLAKAKDLYAYWLDAGPLPPHMMEAATRAQQRAHVHVRPLNFRNMRREAMMIRDIYNRAWSGNWGFVPLGEDEIIEIARNLRIIADRELSLVAEIDGQPVGFVICLPDLNRAVKGLDGRLFPLGWLKLWRAKRRIDFIRIFTLGILPERHPVGIGALLYSEVWQRGVRKGTKAGEASWVLEDNAPMNAAMQMMGGRIYKTWRMYESPLNPVVT